MREENIHKLTLVPHSSHFTQPLDVSFFRGYRKTFDIFKRRKEVEGFEPPIGLSEAERVRRHVLMCALNAIQSEGTKLNIISAFHKTGIHPYNPNRVVDNPLLIQLQEPMMNEVRDVTTQTSITIPPDRLVKQKDVKEMAKRYKIGDEGINTYI